MTEEDLMKIAGGYLAKSLYDGIIGDDVKGLAKSLKKQPVIGARKDYSQHFGIAK